MKVKQLLDSLSMRNKSLSYRLTIIFALFFLFPVTAFAYFAYRYDILSDEFTPLLAIALLIASFFGYTIIRKIFDDIHATSQDMTETIMKDMKSFGPADTTSELQGIVQSFHTIKKELLNSFSSLERRVSQISVLKELSDLCYVTFDAEDLFYVTLERALKLVNADIGSVLILEQQKREYFIIQSTIGTGGDIPTKGDRVDFASSIAKYAVINKSPLLIDDIESDIRFKRTNNPRYGTKSFLCMPLKGIENIIGVLNLSRSGSDVHFTQDDVDVLTPLLSGAAFTYENLNMMKKNELQDQQLKALYDLHHILNSSLRGDELLNSLFKRIQLDIPFDIAMLLIENENNPANLQLHYFLANFPNVLARQTDYPYTGTVLERVIKESSSILADDPGQWVHPVEQTLFLNHHLVSCLLCPLKGASKIKGVLAIGSLQPHILTNAKERIEHLANLAAQAMETDWLAASAMKRDQEMALIRQIGSLLAASTFDMKEVLEHTMDLIKATMEVEAGYLFLLDKDELLFSVGFCTDERINMDILRDLRIKLGQGISGYCAARGETIMVQNAEESKHFSRQTDRIAGFTTRSVLCVPLISQGRVIGVLEVINKYGGEFNKHDQQLLQSIATLDSIAMENARLYQKTLSMAEQEHGIRKMFQKFVPKEIVDRITHDAEIGKTAINELKTITLMNIDIRGFSSLSRTLGPQKTVAVLNHFFSIMGEIVFKHYGIVDKYLGDGFLALFGAPVSDIHDADHAVIAALEMRAAVKSINDQFAGEIKAPITIGISIHTGEAVVGNIGFEKKMDYTVIGDAVNTVFRLQDLTRTLMNGILISEKVLRALSDSRLEVQEMGYFDAGEELGELKIYELMGVKVKAGETIDKVDDNGCTKLQ